MMNVRVVYSMGQGPRDHERGTRTMERNACPNGVRRLNLFLLVHGRVAKLRVKPCTLSH